MDHLARMSLTVTLALLVAALALAVFAGWRGSRPWDPRRGVRMVPWRFIMLLSGAAIMVLSIHIGNLMGVPQRPY
jgi:hypothetical protein